MGFNSLDDASFRKAGEGQMTEEERERQRDSIAMGVAGSKITREKVAEILEKRHKE